MFGGQDNNNETLSDLWRFCLNDWTWERIKPEGDAPRGRTGHTMIKYGDNLVIFGGLLEVTKET